MTEQINKEIKKSKCIGISKLFSLNVETYLMSCPKCKNLFNIEKSVRGIKQCPNCKEKILI